MFVSIARATDNVRYYIIEVDAVYLCGIEVGVLEVVFRWKGG